VRAATREDAEAVGTLGAEFVAYLRALGDPDPQSLDAAGYVRDGFGDQPAFSGLVAEVDGVVVGYLLYCRAYDLDLGGRIVYVIDLFVHEASRRRGIARALMEATADICRQGGGQALLWTVYAPNEPARAFYASLGAQTFRDLEYMHWPV
jgi:GNAT superfamily N-acetyltransferase